MQTEAQLLQAEAKTRKRIRASVAALLLWPRRHRFEDVEQSVLLARIDAANAGGLAADAQLRKLLPRLDAAIKRDVTTAGPFGGRWVADDVDLYRARRAAFGLEKSVTVENQILPWRVDTTAATESSEAFNRGLHEEAQKIQSSLDVDLWRVWTAYLDACPICAGMDGERVRVGESFAGGMEPGRVHPRCRCTSYIET